MTADIRVGGTTLFQIGTILLAFLFSLAFPAIGFNTDINSELMQAVKDDDISSVKALLGRARVSGNT